MRIASREPAPQRASILRGSLAEKVTVRWMRIRSSQVGRAHGWMAWFMPQSAATQAAAQMRSAPSPSLPAVASAVSQPRDEEEVQRLSRPCITVTALGTLTREAAEVPRRSSRCTVSGRLVTAHDTVSGPGGMVTSATLVSGGISRSISFAPRMYSACTELQSAAAYASKQSREYSRCRSPDTCLWLVCSRACSRAELSASSPMASRQAAVNSRASSSSGTCISGSSTGGSDSIARSTLTRACRTAWRQSRAACGELTMCPTHRSKHSNSRCSGSAIATPRRADASATSRRMACTAPMPLQSPATTRCVSQGTALSV